MDHVKNVDGNVSPTSVTDFTMPLQYFLPPGPSFYPSTKWGRSVLFSLRHCNEEKECKSSKFRISNSGFMELLMSNANLHVCSEHAFFWVKNPSCSLEILRSVGPRKIYNNYVML
jgi:hypothetical protein